MQEYNINEIEIESEDNSKEIPELLTGEEIKGLPAKSPIQANIETEKDEWIQFPDGTTQKVDGENHEKGGAKMKVPDGTKVISNNLKLTSSQVKTLKKEFDIEVSTKDTYATAIDRYTRKIGLKKLNEEQEDVFKELQRTLEKKGDTNTLKVNQEYLSKKIYNLEQSKLPKEKERSNFFNAVFDMQESTKKPASNDGTMKYGGMSKANFEAMCKKMGMDPEKAMAMMEDGGEVEDKELPMYPEGGIFVEDKSQMAATGDNLTDDQKASLLQYYSKFNKELAGALKSGSLKWEDHVFNKGLLQDLTTTSPENIPTGFQSRDKSAQGLSSAGTYGGLSPERVQGFLLKEYYENKNPGKKFENISKQEVGQLQKEYNDALSKKGYNYYSGVKGDTEVSDDAFGNRTSSYIRRKELVKGTKEGVIDVDKMYGKTPDEINAQLKDYGLTYDDIKDYQNAAVKYIQVTPETKAPETPETKKDEKDKTTTAKEGEIKDLVKKPQGANYPRLFFTPDQSVLPPSPMEAHLKNDIRLQRIDPVRIGIENNLQEISDQRQFVTDQLNQLPESQRAAALSNLLATSQDSANKAITAANVTNAQNVSQAELFNINQSGQEELYNANNALDFERRQLTAKAKTEEELRRYYDFNRKVNLNNFQNQQRLNMLDSLFPNATLDPFGMTVQYEETPFELEDRSALLWAYQNGVLNNQGTVNIKT